MLPVIGLIGAIVGLFIGASMVLRCVELLAGDGFRVENTTRRAAALAVAGVVLMVVAVVVGAYACLQERNSTSVRGGGYSPRETPLPPDVEERMAFVEAKWQIGKLQPNFDPVGLTYEADAVAALGNGKYRVAICVEGRQFECTGSTTRMDCAAK